jgi:hypothetical protein
MENIYFDDNTEDDTCQRCGGAGGYHDCGEDTCCCADPEDVNDDWITCEDCGGSGNGTT